MADPPARKASPSAPPRQVAGQPWEPMKDSPTNNRAFVLLDGAEHDGGFAGFGQGLDGELIGDAFGEVGEGDAGR